VCTEPSAFKECNVNNFNCRGVGCIFTEMVSGTATFPGTKDAWDQLDRIWQVKCPSFTVF
jgi:hypothetical protein